MALILYWYISPGDCLELFLTQMAALWWHPELHLVSDYDLILTSTSLYGIAYLHGTNLSENYSASLLLNLSPSKYIYIYKGLDLL